MAADFPYLYPYSHREAERRGDTQRYDASFRENVCCARAIEQAIRDHFNDADETLAGDCAQSVLEQYGFKRVNFVLANSLREFQQSSCKHLVSEETYQWGQGIFVPPDGKSNRYYAADTSAALLESFIRQTRQAYQALELFGPEHCIGDRNEQDYKGRVLVMSPDTLRESCWSPRDQLWLANGGAGCSPTSLGQAVFAVCLSDGERTRWNRTDFTGVLDEQYLPDWAAEKLEELSSPQQEQDSGPVMGSMT
jgi:hypothetical protein